MAPLIYRNERTKMHFRISFMQEFQGHACCRTRTCFATTHPVFLVLIFIWHTLYDISMPFYYIIKLYTHLEHFILFSLDIFRIFAKNNEERVFLVCVCVCVHVRKIFCTEQIEKNGLFLQRTKKNKFYVYMFLFLLLLIYLQLTNLLLHFFIFFPCQMCMYD